MKLVYDHNQKKLRELEKKADFYPLVEELKNAPDQTLRQLKSKFSNGSFLRFLEEMIEADVVQRENRRYKILPPIYQMKEYQKVLLANEAKIQQAISLDATKLAQLYLQERGMQPQFPCYFIEDNLPTLAIDCLTNAEIQVISVSCKTDSRNNLPGYFAANRNLTEPRQFQVLRELIGDVDEEYFLDQMSWIIRRVQKGKKPRRTIFLEALLATDILRFSEEEYQLTIPVMKIIADFPQSTLTSWEHFEKSSWLGAVCQHRDNGLYQWLGLANFKES